MENLTIGQLANKVGIKTSTLRYYEEQGLLTPIGRTKSGYRLYDPEAEQVLQVIRRSQRLGFSLADVRVLLEAWQSGSFNSQNLIHIVEDRFLFLERRLTEALVRRHEMGLFLQELRGWMGNRSSQEDEHLFDLIQSHLYNTLEAHSPLDRLEWLMSYTGCSLTSEVGIETFLKLKDQHFHIWQEDASYHVLVISEDPEVFAVLRSLAKLESECQIHAHTSEAPELYHNDEGFLLIAKGENAFIFARLFLELSQLDHQSG
jgi:DNA-binding transcriptional MerR regulator